MDADVLHIREGLDKINAQFEDHKSESEEYKSKTDKLLADVVTSTDNNAAVVDKLVQVVEQQSSDTKGLVEAWNATNGAITVSKVLGKTVLWFAGLLAAIAAITTFTKG